MNLIQYIKELAGASKPHWEAGKQMHTALSSGITLLAALLVAMGFAKGLDIQSILQTLVLALAFWVAFTFVFVAPYRLLDADRKTIEQLREQIADKANRDRIAKLLAAQMMKGRDFMAQCTIPEVRGAINDDLVTQWLSETQRIVGKELGPVYYALLEAPDGTAPVEHVEDKAVNVTWNGLRYRVANLRRMVQELVQR